MYASTVPDTTASDAMPWPEAKPPRPTAIDRAIASMFGASAVIVRLPASMSTPSPTYARVIPITSAFGSMTATVKPPAAPKPSALAMAVIEDRAEIVIAAEWAFTLVTVPDGVSPAAVPMWASTTPLTSAVASAPTPPARPPTATATVVAVAE